MINIFLKGKYFWESGDSSVALQLLNEILKGDEYEETFYVPSRFISSYIQFSFENAVSSILLNEDQLLIPFELAFEKLLNTFPAQFMILVIQQKELERVASSSLVKTVAQAASKGLLSYKADDYDLSGRLVLRREDNPELFNFLGGDRLHSNMNYAIQNKLWNSFVSENPDLLINLFFYAVFHREKQVNKEMILIRLEQIAEIHSDFLCLSNEAIGNYLNQHEELEDLVKFGMRLEHVTDPAKCLNDFIKVNRSQNFDEFLNVYFP